jgi:prefoldin subunit 5
MMVVEEACSAARQQLQQQLSELRKEMDSLELRWRMQLPALLLR